MAIGGVERDVDYGFQVDGLAFFGGGLEFPFAEGGDGVGVELGVDATNELNAIDGAIAADDGVKSDFTFDVSGHEILRIFRVDLAKRRRGAEFAGAADASC